MGAWPVKVSSAFPRAVHRFLQFHKLTFHKVCSGLLLVSDFLPLSLAALLSSLRCEQTPRRLRTGWDFLHHLPAFGRPALLKPRRSRGAESYQSQEISQADALWSAKSWDRGGRIATEGFLGLAKM